MFASDLPRVGAGAFGRALSVDDLLGVRQDVLDHAAAAGVPAGQSADLALAVHEVAANSVEHARGTGLFRIWQDDDALMCDP